MAGLREISNYLQFKRDCKIVFTSVQGSRVLKYLMKKGCVTTPCASTSHDESLRNEGMQRLVLSIMKATHKNESELENLIEEEQQQ